MPIQVAIESIYSRKCPLTETSECCSPWSLGVRLPYLSSRKPRRKRLNDPRSLELEAMHLALLLNSIPMPSYIEKSQVGLAKIGIVSSPHVILWGHRAIMVSH